MLPTIVIFAAINLVNAGLRNYSVRKHLLTCSQFKLNMLGLDLNSLLVFLTFVQLEVLEVFKGVLGVDNHF